VVLALYVALHSLAQWSVDLVVIIATPENGFGAVLSVKEGGDVIAEALIEAVGFVTVGFLRLVPCGSFAGEVSTKDSTEP